MTEQSAFGRGSQRGRLSTSDSLRAVAIGISALLLHPVAAQLPAICSSATPQLSRDWFHSLTSFADNDEVCLQVMATSTYTTVAISVWASSLSEGGVHDHYEVFDGNLQRVLYITPTEARSGANAPQSAFASVALPIYLHFKADSTCFQTCPTTSNTQCTCSSTCQQTSACSGQRVGSKWSLVYLRGISCPAGTRAQFDKSSGSATCVDCPSGTYSTESALSCASCGAGCDTCSNSTACAVCSSGYSLSRSGSGMCHEDDAEGAVVAVVVTLIVFLACCIGAVVGLRKCTRGRGHRPIVPTTFSNANAAAQSAAPARSEQRGDGLELASRSSTEAEELSSSPSRSRTQRVLGKAVSELEAFEAGIRYSAPVTSEFRAEVKDQLRRALNDPRTNQPYDLWRPPSVLSEQFGPGIGLYFHLARRLLILMSVLLCLGVVSAVANSSATPSRGGSNEASADAADLSLVNDPDYAFMQPLIYVASFVAAVLLYYHTQASLVAATEESLGSRLFSGDFTVHVTKVPPTATVADVTDHFSRFGTVRRVVLVPVYGDTAKIAQQLLTLEKEVNRLRDVLAAQGPGAMEKTMYVIPYQVADKLKELETQERVLKSRMLTAAAQRTSLASGHAFVSFTTPGEATACLKEYSMGTVWYYLSRCCNCSKRLRIHNVLVRVRSALEPSDLQYHNLEVTWLQRKLLILRSTGLIWILIATSVTIQVVGYFLKQRCVATPEHPDGRCSRGYVYLLTGFSSGVSTMMSTLITNQIIALSKDERHPSATVEAVSIVKKAVRVHLLVSVLALLFIYVQPSQWHVKGNLLDQVTSGLMTDSIFAAVKAVLRHVVVQRAMSERAMQKETRQGPLLRACKPAQFSVTKPYIELLNTLNWLLVYLPLIPWGAGVAFVGLVAQQVAQRHLLLRANLAPQWCNHEIAFKSFSLVKSQIKMSFYVAFYIFPAIKSVAPNGSDDSWAIAMSIATMVYGKLLTETGSLSRKLNAAAASVAKQAVAWETTSGLHEYTPPDVDSFVQEILKDVSSVIALPGPTPEPKTPAVPFRIGQASGTEEEVLEDHESQ